MKITIILNEPYPYGMACTNRIHLYAKGLNNAGALTKIILPKPKIVDKNLNVPYKGTFDGVKYQYASKNAYRSGSFLKRRFADFFGVLLSFFLCLREKPNVIIFVGGGISNIILYKIVSRITKSLYYREKSEIPYMDKDIISNHETQKIKQESSYFDGLIVITDKLGDFFTKDLKLSLKTITIPILIEKINNSKSLDKKNGDYILYTGSLLDRKDGVLTLFEAFSIVLKKHPDLKLYITGNAEHSTDYNKIMNAINQLGIKQNIVFTGFISQLDLNQLIKNASLSIMLKPENRQNKYNFPTKIGEYMVLGCPVVATKNSTLEKYFIGDENIYFTEFSVDKIANKILHAYENPDISKTIGIKGKNMVTNLFDANIQMKKLIDYFKNELN